MQAALYIKEVKQNDTTLTRDLSFGLSTYIQLYHAANCNIHV